MPVRSRGRGWPVSARLARCRAPRRRTVDRTDSSHSTVAAATALHAPHPRAIPAVIGSVGWKGVIRSPRRAGRVPMAESLGRAPRARAFQPHARAKKLPRAAECLVYSLTPSGVLAENHPKNRGFVGILRGQKCLRRGQKCLKRRFFTAISRWRVVSRRALDASGF